MTIKFRKNAIKFLQKVDIEDSAKIREKREHPKCAKTFLPFSESLILPLIFGASCKIGMLPEKLNQLLIFVEEQGIIPFTELDIKKMKGDWEGFYRLRIGKFRIVFLVNTDSAEIEIYTIGARGDVYK